MAKKRDARAKLLFWLLNLFLTFLLPSPSSDVKRPILPLNDGEADTLGYYRISLLFGPAV